MRIVLRPLPVVYACQGCETFGDAAHGIALELERRGQAEACWLGGPGDRGAMASKARSRFPVYALDGCPRNCALNWLQSQGVTPQRHDVLPGGAKPEGWIDLYERT